MAKEKLFIIGGLGYIGAVLAQEAVKRGHEVCIYDSLIFEQDRLRMLGEIGEVKLIIGDTRNETLLRRSLKEFKPTYVFHLAELSSVYMCNHNPILTKDINYEASKRVIDICTELKFKVIYNSTSSLYGTQKEDRLMTESDHLPRATDLYCGYKHKMEQYIEGKKNVLVFRPATVFGISPRFRIDLMPNHFTYMAVCRKTIAISEPKSGRAGIDVHELVEGYFKVLERGEWKHGVYNIGHYNLTKQEFAEGLQQILDCDIRQIEMQDTRNLKIDCSRFNDEFGFNPQTSYVENIRKVVHWMQAHAEHVERTNFNEILNMPLSKWKSICV